MDKTTLTLTAGGATGTITATVLPADATNKTVTWTSSDEAVATVSAGVVTPLTAGTTTITATTVDGEFTATTAVTVTTTVVDPQDIQVEGNGFKNSSTYKGVFVEISLPGTANDQIESLKVELFNANNELIGTNTLNSAATAHGAGLTSPFVVIQGDYTSKSWTTSWVDGKLSASNAPSYAVITAVDNNGVSYSAEAEYTGDWASILPVAMIGTTQYDSIQAAIDAAVVGDNLIMVYPANHGTGSINIIQREGVNITLEAVGEVELKNQIRIDGNARLGGTESLTIKGFTFDFSDKSGDIITTAKKDGQKYAYAHNVSIEDCIFIGNKNNNTVVAIRAGATGGHRNFQFDGCTGTNLHSLAQLTSVNGVTVNDCSVSGGKSGINLNTSTDITITKFTVDGTGDESYGVRAGQGSGTNESTLTISNSELKAQYPIWLRGGAPETVTITDSTLEHTEYGERIRNDAEVNVLEDPTV